MLIWWTNQADCEAIEYVCSDVGDEGRLDDRFPKYLREQYNDRYGRNGRGRLWVDEQFGKPSVPWPRTALGEVLGEKTRFGQTYAGIVIRDEDVKLFKDMPGIVTTLWLERPS
jgi:hypothetical protein